jgi:hypothetical protein
MFNQQATAPFPATGFVSHFDSLAVSLRCFVSSTNLALPSLPAPVSLPPQQFLLSSVKVISPALSLPYHSLAIGFEIFANEYAQSYV